MGGECKVYLAPVSSSILVSVSQRQDLRHSVGVGVRQESEQYNVLVRTRSP